MLEKENSDQNKTVSDKHLEEKVLENKFLNNSKKKLDVEQQHLHKDLHSLHKDLKIKKKKFIGCR